MSGPADRALIEQLLEDGSLSYREIGRRAGCSDWTVRSVARQLTCDVRPMKRGARRDNDESNGFVGWFVLVGIIGLFIGALWLGARGLPPSDESTP